MKEGSSALKMAAVSGRQQILVSYVSCVSRISMSTICYGYRVSYLCLAGCCFKTALHCVCAHASQQTHVNLPWYRFALSILPWNFHLVILHPLQGIFRVRQEIQQTSTRLHSATSQLLLVHLHLLSTSLTRILVSLLIILSHDSSLGQRSQNHVCRLAGLLPRWCGSFALKHEHKKLGYLSTFGP
jgi:hypothetical protein